MLSALVPVMHAFHAAYSLRMGLSTEVSIIPYRQGNSEELNAVVWEGDRPGWKANPMTLNGNLNANNREILEKKGFEVVSVRCKAGAVPKEKIGIKPDAKIRGPGYWETMCNPILQAEVVNEEKVDLAVMLGLCIGHDTLFMQYCRRPMTVIAVKDRVTGHNPLAALYLSGSYYARLIAKER